LISLAAVLCLTVGSGSSAANANSGSAPVLPKTLSGLCSLPYVQGVVVRFAASDGAELVGAVAGKGRVGIELANSSDGEICDWVANEHTLINALVARGYRVLLFDYRGTGRSAKVSGKPSGAWGKDAIGAATELRRLGSRQVVLAGASTGGIVALAAAGSVRPAPVAIVALSTSGDPGPTSTSADKGGLDGKAAVETLRVPLLLVAARQDAYAVAPTRLLFRLARTSDKQLVLVPGQAHGFFDLDPSGPTVDTRILDFIASHVRG
jgi:pimeloyl-ACP methyl ester carboxylesterase